MAIYVIFLGPAGAGKSTLLATYSSWLASNVGAKAVKVNLDPAADYVPYIPDFDIRTIVNTRDIASKFRLGPNGALVKAIELITEELDYVTECFSRVDADYILIDTPGQMEVFIFRDIGPKLAELLKRYSRWLIAVFVTDALVIKNPDDYAFIALMSTALRARLGIDIVPVVNKVDLVGDLGLVGDVVSDVWDVVKLLRGRGAYGEMMAEVLEVIWGYAKAAKVPKVSAITFEGIEELHRIIHEVTCSCGDLT